MRSTPRWALAMTWKRILRSNILRSRDTRLVYVTPTNTLYLKDTSVRMMMHMLPPVVVGTCETRRGMREKTRGKEIEVCWVRLCSQREKGVRLICLWKGMALGVRRGRGWRWELLVAWV